MSALSSSSTSMSFTDFSLQVLQPIERTSKKLEQTKILAEYLSLAATQSPQDIEPSLLLILGQMGPLYKSPEFHFGIEFFLRSLAELQLAGKPPEVKLVHTSQSLFGDDVLDEGSENPLIEESKKELKKRYKVLGDVGEIAQEIREACAVVPTQPTIQEVFDALFHITEIGGFGSQEEKVQKVTKLFLQCDPLSVRYLARILVGTLRFGMSDKTILDALSWSQTGDKTLRELLDDVYQRHPDITLLATTLLTEGKDAVARIDAQVGVPVLPALCDRLKSADEMIAKMGTVIVEPKYDGTRVQIHYDAQTGTLATYTRNLEESTAMFPELLPALKKLGVQNVVFDAEAVGFNPETGELVSFQVTIKRKRKHDIESVAESIPLRFFLFDVLFYNGESQLRVPLRQRKALLQKIIEADSSTFVQAPYITTNNPEELREFHKKQLNAGLEGVVIKKEDGPYQSGRQAFNWVKFKEEEGQKAKLSDTIDAVVLGYYTGKGKRTQFGVGAFLIGILDPQTDKILTIAKIGTGLTDDLWRELKQRADDILSVTNADAKVFFSVVIPELLQPDVVLPPVLVVEIAADEITQSPLHSAGVALRFPRLVKFRDDKSVRDITTVSELKSIM